MNSFIHVLATIISWVLIFNFAPNDLKASLIMGATGLIFILKAIIEKYFAGKKEINPENYDKAESDYKSTKE